MTNLQALKARVNYPLSDTQAEEKLIGRSIDANDDFDASIAESKQFQLAYADTLRFIITMVNLSQGGSISAQNMAGIRGTANAIYKKYGEDLIGEMGDELSVVEDMSNNW